MTVVHTRAYQTAFGEYLRRGTPIFHSLKQDTRSERYVWHTQRDTRVRGSHRENDGRVFSWTNPPPSGHPGADFNCRCWAEPFVEGQTEFGHHDFTTSLASSTDRWDNRDFIHHYYFGGGRDFTLLEIGHLREIAEQYAFGDGAKGAFRRLSDQIADEARTSGEEAFSYEFGAAYDFGDVAFSHGDSVVRGIFTGRAEDLGAMIRITGETYFEYSDVFEDPLGMRVEVGGRPYPVTGAWTATFSAEVLKDPTRSQYRSVRGQ